jgi:NAD(P)H-dependent FMN reductase
MHKVLIIVGSTRPNRIGSQVADWVSRNIPASAGLETELTELADWYLPMSDEPGLPSAGEYVQEHTRAWSRKIAAAEGFILVTPQYNWGYPASLKNALDHLYKEWNGKPVMIVSYGHRGGGKAAAQLRQVCEGLRMRPAKTMPAIAFSKEMLGEKGRLRGPSTDFAPYAEAVQQAIGELAGALGRAGSPEVT